MKFLGRWAVPLVVLGLLIFVEVVKGQTPGEYRALIQELKDQTLNEYIESSEGLTELRRYDTLSRIEDLIEEQEYYNKMEEVRGEEYYQYDGLEIGDW